MQKTIAYTRVAWYNQLTFEYGKTEVIRRRKAIGSKEG